MDSLGLVRDIPVLITDRVMHADLIVVRLEHHGVILGMDWLGKNRLTLDCHWSLVQFESGCGPPIRFQGILFDLCGFSSPFGTDACKW